RRSDPAQALRMEGPPLYQRQRCHRPLPHHEQLWRRWQRCSLYGSELHFLKEAAFDFPVAGARLLGHDTALLCAGPTRKKLAALLTDAPAMERLSEQMAGRRGWEDEAHRNSVSRLLHEFREGF